MSPNGPGKGAGASRPWLHLDFTGGVAAPDGVPVLADPMAADSVTVADAIRGLVADRGPEDPAELTAAVTAELATLRGLAGLEQLTVWWRARELADTDSSGACTVTCSGPGRTPLGWLRLLAGPGELAGLLDVFAPRVERHRQMPEVFGPRAGRARALENLWGICTRFDRSVFHGGAVVHVPAGDAVGVAAVAEFLGLPVMGPDGAITPEAPRLDARGTDSDGALLFTWRVPVPAQLADTGACGAEVRGRSAVVWAGPWRRSMTLPAVLGVCDHYATECRPRPGAGPAGAGDILMQFRSRAGLLPGGQ